MNGDIYLQQAEETVSNQIEPTLSLDGAASKEGVAGDKNSDAAAVLSLKNVKVHSDKHPM